MKKTIIIAIIAALLLSCKEEFKKCNFQTTDYRLKAYNDILNEIILHGTYNRYLGENEEEIFTRYINNRADSDNIQKDVIQLHNKIFSDSSKHCILYIDTFLKYKLNYLKTESHRTHELDSLVKDLMQGFSDEPQAALDSFSMSQYQYKPTDFKTCIAKIKPLGSLITDTTQCYIGRISLSKLIINKAKSKGLMYFEFRCGGACGYGNLILIEKRNEDWHIERFIRTWVS